MNAKKRSSPPVKRVKMAGGQPPPPVRGGSGGTMARGGDMLFFKVRKTAANSDFQHIFAFYLSVHPKPVNQRVYIKSGHGMKNLHSHDTCKVPIQLDAKARISDHHIHHMAPPVGEGCHSSP